MLRLSAVDGRDLATAPAGRWLAVLLSYLGHSGNSRHVEAGSLLVGHPRRIGEGDAQLTVIGDRVDAR